MNRPSKQRGVVLVIGLLMLLLLTIIGVSAMSTTVNTERTAGNNQYATINFQAAESAVKVLFNPNGVGPTIMAAGNQVVQTNNFDVTLDQVSSATIQVNTTSDARFCGEDPFASGTSLCSGPQDPNCRQMLAFDVVGSSNIAGAGARENHLKRGARIGPNLGFNFNGTGTYGACITL